MAAPKKLFKTTLVIWTEYNPEDLEEEIDDLARSAIDGDGYCSKQEVVEVTDLAKDPDWDDTEFFNTGDDEDE